MFDFPTSPATGTISNGFQWDGEKWLGGSGPATPVTEQFFDLTGATTYDITAPTWAKSVEFTAFINNSTAAGGSLMMRVSTDGTTFFAGASDYQTMGFIHYTGSGGFANVPAAAAAQLSLSGSHDNTAQPIVVEGHFLLARPSNAITFGGMVRAKGYNSGAAFLWMDSDWRILLAASTTDVRVQKLRFFAAVPFAAGSYLRVKWLGDYAQVPTGNAVADAPSDGGEYVRVNGLWRLKQQTFTPTAAQIILVPANARMAKITGTFYMATTGYSAMRWSIDGTTFEAGATSYTVAGNIFYAGSAAIAKGPPNSSSSLGLHQTVDTPSVPAHVDLNMVTAKAISANQGFGYQLHSQGYNSSATAYYTDYSYAGYSSVAALNNALALKAIQIYPATGTWAAGTSIDVEWVY